MGAVVSRVSRMPLAGRRYIVSVSATSILDVSASRVVCKHFVRLENATRRATIYHLGVGDVHSGCLNLSRRVQSLLAPFRTPALARSPSASTVVSSASSGTVDSGAFASAPAFPSAPATGAPSSTLSRTFLSARHLLNLYAVEQWPYCERYPVNICW